MTFVHTLHDAAGAGVEIHAHGAHITSWRTADGVERLFLSRCAEFRPGAAIRGGVPIIFPQFAGLGALPKHGFARTAPWRRVDMPDAAGNSVLFRLQDSAATRAVWPYQFVAEYAVTLARDTLAMQLSIRNAGRQPFTFTAALHSYLRVQDIAEVAIAGLQGLRYSDSAAGGAAAVATAAALRIAGEVDRIYFGASRPVRILESGRPTLECGATGFADVVVWNPGADKAAALTDLEPGGHRHMVCVEAAAIEQPIALPPQTSWSGAQYLTLL